jgi:hypothetical protein
MADEVPTRVQPLVLPDAGGLKITWPGSGWKARIDRFVDSGKELYAEVTYLYGANGHDNTVAGPLDLNLKSGKVGAEQVKLILARCEIPDSQRSGLQSELDTMVAQIQRESVRWYRSPPRPLEMADVTAEEGAPMYLIPQLIQKDAINTIVADGGGGKSYLALAIATALATGSWMIPRLQPMEQGPVLYMDFEWDIREHARRLWQITRGLGLDERPKGIHHLSFDKPLRKVHGVHEVVAEIRPILIIVDSLGYALGGDITSQEPVSEAFQVIRSWGVTTLVLHHMNREKAYFGTIYIKNSTRNLWLMDSTPTPDGLHLHLKNDKANSGRAGGWMDLRIGWSEDERTGQLLRDVLRSGAGPGCGREGPRLHGRGR